MSFPSGKGKLNFIKSPTVNCGFVLGKVKLYAGEEKAFGYLSVLSFNAAT